MSWGWGLQTVYQTVHQTPEIARSSTEQLGELAAKKKKTTPQHSLGSSKKQNKQKNPRILLSISC